MSDDIADYEIYTRRRSERALCSDFPADIAIIDGLKRWQVHLWNNGSNFTIPVLTVMNCAHHCAAHMLSGLEPYDDRDGYDFRIFKHVGQDRIIMAVVIVVLAAMLRRTEDSDRAYTCLRIITDDRPEDFYDRLSLFEHYVDTSQMVRYREKELLRDAAILLERIAQLEAEKQQQTTYIQTLEKKIDIMEKETKHININNYGTYIAEQHNDIHDNHNCNIYTTPAPQQTQAEPEVAETLPPEGDYQRVVQWLANEKQSGTDHYATAQYNRSKMCRHLSDIFGWLVNENSLRKAQEREQN